MNIIGIDISINSTAIYIENKEDNKILSFTNKKDNNIYIKELSSYGVEFIHLDKIIKTKSYSDNELLKLKQFDRISDIIYKKVKENIDTTKKTFCQIEGYSFSKNTSSILDIVSFSTMIKIKLINNIPDINMSIISPSSLKLEACKLSYKPIDIGIKKPKFVYKNNEGISGGSFKKHQMFKAMIDGNIKSPISLMLNQYIHLLKMKSIPNPIEDIIDAIFACKSKIKEIENDIR